MLRTALSLVLGLALAAGPVAEVHGFHDCPHHGEHHAPASDGSTPSTAHAHGHHAGPGSGPLEAPPQGPCTCLASCHGVPTAPGMATVPSVPVAPAVADRILTPRPEGRTRLPGAYVLPFPNGPPALPA